MAMVFDRLSRIWRAEGVIGIADRAVRRLGLPRSLVYEIWRRRHSAPCPPPAREIGPDHVLLIEPGIRLEADAEFWFARALAHRPDAKLIYADHDHLWHGLRIDPWFKPDFDPVLLGGLDFIGGAAVVRRDLLDGHRMVVDVARTLTQADVVHIPHVLFSTPWTRRAEPRPVVLPDPPAWPKISILIPTRDQPALLKRCLAGLDMTDYPALEIILIDHETQDEAALALIEGAKARGAKVIPVTGPFNYAAFNNLAAAQASGDFLLLLNNDVEARDASWLKAMMRHAVDPQTGAVGARLFYPDGSLQHGGVIVGIGGVANHAQLGLKSGAADYMHLTAVARQLSAVTAACMLTPRAVFEAVGGLDAAQFTVAFNDVDYCLKLRSRGLKVIYAPEASLTHHESASRGRDIAPDKRRRFDGEIAAMRRLWGAVLDRDPFYHPALSLNGTDYLPAMAPRWEAPWKVESQ